MMLVLPWIDSLICPIFSLLVVIFVVDLSFEFGIVAPVQTLSPDQLHILHFVLGRGFQIHHLRWKHKAMRTIAVVCLKKRKATLFFGHTRTWNDAPRQDNE